MAKVKKDKLPLEELLEQALVKEEDRPYEVPKNWVWTRLDNIVSICTGKRDANYGNENGEYYFFTCAAQPIRCDGYSFEGESILLAGNGANVGLALYYNGKFEAYQRTYVIQPKHGISLKYVFYHFKGFWKEYNSDKQYGSATNYIKLGNFLSYPVPFPTLSEQQRIVDVIESLFEKLDKAKELVQNALDSFESRKAAILHKAFKGELTAKWREKNGVSLEDWEEKSFEDCAILMQNGISKRSGNVGELKVVLRLANIKDNSIVTEDLRRILLNEKEVEQYSLNKNDILIIRVNGSVENVGKLILIDNDEKWAFCDHLIKLRVNQEKVLAQYLVYKSMTDEYKQFVKDNMVSSAGQNTISQKSLSMLVLKVPKINEQQEIVSILDNLLGNEQRAKELCDVIEKIDLMKKAILARAFRGELGTNNPDEESAIGLLKEILKEKSGEV